ncbi:alpha/beta hydrolase [Lacticaseibacillus absianus]|uniref:alpha/beta hydrolase n=1 Tax=Lacticaseibacillus absianus TaxID=2729623 RepID=UPI0015C7E9B3|nr:alpha/beta hydrolase [Lacticaseibacillus absianus]
MHLTLNETRHVSLDYFGLAHASKSAAVLILPGGGYGFISPRESAPIAEAFNQQGFQSLVLNYSVAEHRGYQHALDDVHAAFQAIAAHQEDWRIDPQKVILIGFSAGGHLAAAYASTTTTYRPALVVLGYACILASMNDLLAIEGPSLDRLVTPANPPTFLFGTAEDDLVPVDNTLAFMAALSRAKVPFEGHIFQFGPHGLSLGTSRTADGDPRQIDPHYATWFPRCLEWIDRSVD